MKKINLVLIMIMLLVTVSVNNNYASNEVSTDSVGQFEDYCKGFDLGFKYGWMSVKGDLSMPPMSPPCPMPEIGETSQLDGYNRGFVVGRRAGANSN
jgi:hypothetical protein